MLEAIMFTRTQGTKLNEFDIINRVISLRSKVKVLDDETNAQLDVSSGYPTYIPATEPDGDRVKLYLFLDHVAESYRDHSGFGNHATISYYNSTPDIDTDGPDLGNGHLSRALKFDSTKQVVVTIPDNGNIRVAGLTTGFSLTLRIRLTSLTTIGGKNRRLYVKWDDANNNIIVLVDSTGKIEVHVEIGGVTTRWETTNQEIFIDKFYTITIVYNVTGPALTVYVTEDGQAAGAAKALTSGIGSRDINSSTTDLIIGGYDAGTFGSFDGSSVVTVPHAAPLSLSKFSIAVRFKTSKDYTEDLAGYMVTKGNYLTETAGNNINYALLISTDVDPNNVLEVLFETSAGVNKFCVASGFGRVNDGQWHIGVGTFDGALSKIYVDGVLYNTVDFTGSVPDTGTHDLIVGGHEFFQTFVGDLDDVRIWNNDLTAAEIAAYPTTVPQTGAIVYENLFGAEGLTGGGHVDGNIQWVMYERDVLYTITEAQAIHNNKWTKNPNVGSNKVATLFYTLATTP